MPYSVFLGPGGARFNLPQVYWHTIGVSVGSAYKHTFIFNRVYRRPIDPLGQTYDNPPISPDQALSPHGDLLRPRRSQLVGLAGDGEEGVAGARAKRMTRGVSGVDRPRSYPTLSKGSRGDLVVWAQEHLKGAGESLRVTGVYNRKTATRREELPALEEARGGRKARRSDMAPTA